MCENGICCQEMCVHHIPNDVECQSGRVGHGMQTCDESYRQHTVSQKLDSNLVKFGVDSYNDINKGN